MLERILRAIAKAIDITFALIKFPFQCIFGGLFAPNIPPAFTPTESCKSLADRLPGETKNGIELKKDRVDTLNKYCAAPAPIRDTIDLSVFNPEVRELLLNMDHFELNLLKNSPLKVRRVFIEGGEHGIEELPTVGDLTQKKVDKNTPEFDTLEDMKSRLKAYTKSPSPSY